MLTKGLSLTMLPGDKIKTACVTVLGSGFVPVAPGSWSSLVASLILSGLWWVCAVWVGSIWLFNSAVALGVGLSCILCVRWGPWAVERFEGKDPKPFVLDEFAGQWVALLVPPLAVNADLLSFAWVIGVQFFLFRLLDVVKPPPARQVERWPGGWGILTDDLFAGAYANLIGQLLWRLSPLAAWLGAHGVATHSYGA